MFRKHDAKHMASVLHQHAMHISERQSTGHLFPKISLCRVDPYLVLKQKKSLFGNRQNEDWTFETNIVENVISISMIMPNFKILAQNTFTNNDSSV